MVQRLGHLADHVARLAERHDHARLLQLLDDLAEVLAVDELHGEVQRALDLADVEHLDDVGVRQPPGDLGLVQEQLDRQVARLEELALDPA